jgi:glycosyltransferase involved in cell wall biosynthesis
MALSQFRFLFYSHDGQGLGHTRRNPAIGSAMHDLTPQSSVLLATGSDEISHLGLCGCVLNTDVTSIPEVLHHGKAGLHVRQPDAAGLAEAIELLLCDTELCGQLASRARRLIETDCYSRCNAARLRQLFVQTDLHQERSS